MKKNIIIYISLTIIVLALMVQCINLQIIDNAIGEAPIDIAPYPEKAIEQVTLYFKSPTGDFLSKETRTIERTFESREEAILKELIKGPSRTELQATVPPQTKVFSVLSVDGTTYINFSKEFITPMMGGDRTEATTVYSVVNSLTEIRTVRRVQILVEGERLNIFQKHMSLREPYPRNDSIIREALATPIGVIKRYLEFIAEEEYRRAFEQIYRPGEYDLDFSIFFHYMNSNKKNVASYNIGTYSIFMEPGEAKLVVDFDETLDSKGIIRHKSREFILKNDFGEWKIVPINEYKINSN